MTMSALISAERRWREDPDDQTALRAYIRALERSGAFVPLSLSERLLEAPRSLELTEPVEVWADFPDGRSARIAKGPPWGSQVFQLPACRDWWVSPPNDRAPRLDSLGKALRELKAPGLELSQQVIKGFLVKALGPAPSLTRLRLAGNKVTRKALEGIDSYPSLRELTVAIFDEDANRGLGSSLLPCASLTVLRLAGDPLVGPEFPSLECLPKLRRLSLDRIDLRIQSPAFWKSFERMKSLEELSLCASRLKPESLVHLSRLPRLRRLDLSQCFDIDGRALAILSQCKGLEELSLRGQSELGDSELAPLARLQNLETLRLPATGCGPKTIAALAALPRLRSLDVSECYALDGHALAALRDGPPGLEELSLGDLGDLGPDAWLAIGKRLHLRRLSLYDSGLDNRGLEQLRPLKNLHSLNLISCPRVTNKGLEVLAGFSKLRELSLGPSKRITDAGMPAVIRLPELDRLTLFCCPKISNAGVGTLLGSPALKHLTLYGCHQVSEAGYELLTGLTSLETLSLRNCRQFSDQVFLALATLPRLRALSFNEALVSNEAISRFHSQAPQCQI